MKCNCKQWTRFGHNIFTLGIVTLNKSVFNYLTRCSYRLLYNLCFCPSSLSIYLFSVSYSNHFLSNIQHIFLFLLSYFSLYLPVNLYLSFLCLNISLETSFLPFFFFSLSLSPPLFLLFVLVHLCPAKYVGSKATRKSKMILNPLFINTYPSPNYFDVRKESYLLPLEQEMIERGNYFHYFFNGALL